MRRFVFCLLLAGCSLPEAPLDTPSGRDPAVPVASQADVTEARLRGSWTVVETTRFRSADRVDLDRGRIVAPGLASLLTPVGPGRFATDDGELWVHWMDADNRTVAIGDPKAGWYAILNRRTPIGERLRVARDILAWYGYDLRDTKERT